jgi:hypothetical protein
MIIQDDHDHECQTIPPVRRHTSYRSITTIHSEHLLNKDSYLVSPSQPPQHYSSLSENSNCWRKVSQSPGTNSVWSCPIDVGGRGVVGRGRGNWIGRLSVAIGSRVAFLSAS